MEDSPATTASEQTTSTPEGVPAPAITPEQVATFLGTTPEKFGEYQKFVENSGGFDKAFKTFKSRITEKPQAPAQATPAPSPSEVSPTGVPQAPAQPQSQPLVEGGMTQNEFFIKQYFYDLANEKQYNGIADKIRSGEVIKEMKEFGIAPMVDGVFNDGQIRKYLNLVAKTVPATPTEAPVTSTPTVDYIQIAGDKIENYMDAMNVLAQSRTAEMQGAAPHPLKEQAQQFVKQTLTTQQNRGRREHKTVDPNAK